MKGCGHWGLGFSLACLLHHGRAQDFIYAGLISLSMRLEPCKDIGINSECERLLDGAIKLSHHRAGPVAGHDSMAVHLCERALHS